MNFAVKIWSFHTSWVRHHLRQALKSPHANHVLQKAKIGCQGSFVAVFFFPFGIKSQLSIISLESLRKFSMEVAFWGQGNLQLGKSGRPIAHLPAKKLDFIITELRGA